MNSDERIELPCDHVGSLVEAESNYYHPGGYPPLMMIEYCNNPRWRHSNYCAFHFHQMMRSGHTSSGNIEEDTRILEEEVLNGMSMIPTNRPAYLYADPSKPQ